MFFLIAALNDLDVWAADIKNAYLTALIKVKYYIVVTPDLGLDEEWNGKSCKVVRALYGLPVAGASFREYLAKHLGELGYVPCKADRDVHLRPFERNGEKLYQIAVCYVDDILVSGMCPQDQLKEIATRFELKKGSVEKPSTYLGADIEEVQIMGNDGSPKT